MNETKRPVPIGGEPGRRVWDLAECVAYRKAMGVTQLDVAASMHIAQPNVAAMERARQGVPTNRTIERYLAAIDRIAYRREKLVAEGRAELEQIRARRVAFEGRLDAWSADAVARVPRARKVTTPDRVLGVLERIGSGTARDIWQVLADEEHPVPRNIVSNALQALKLDGLVVRDGRSWSLTHKLTTHAG